MMMKMRLNISQLSFSLLLGSHSSSLIAFQLFEISLRICVLFDNDLFRITFC